MIVQALGLLLASAAAGPPAAALDFEPCLGNPAAANPVAVGGRGRRLRVASGNWDAPNILGRVAQIILNEGVGVETDFAVIGGSGAVLRNLTGCLNDACSEVEDYPYVHFDFENWFTAAGGAILAAQPSVLREGFIGYDGQEGLYMKEELAQRAWEATHLPIEYYATLGHPDRPWTRFFNTSAQMPVNTSATGCALSASSIMNANNLTCDADGWWYSPACADDKPSCIPVLMGGIGWLGLETVKVINVNNVPMAVSFLGWPDPRIQEGTVDVLFFWWRPDWTYQSVGPVRRLLFPKHNRQEWDQGIYTTDFPDFQLRKYMWEGVAGLSHQAAALFDNFRLTWTGINDFMALMHERTPGYNGTDLKFDLACEWVRNNTATWRTWFPAVPPCNPGWGVVAAACVECPAGSLSRPDAGVGNRVCGACPAGSYCPFAAVAAAPCPAGSYCPVNSTASRACPEGTALPGGHGEGEDDCTPCDVGTYSPSTGAATCTSCSAGEWQNDTGQTRCFACDPGQEQPLPGQTLCQSCTAGQVSPSQGNARCAECAPGHVAATTGGTACDRYPVGTYQPNPGSRGCIACAPPMTTQYMSATAATDCGCPPENFVSSREDGLPCSTCTGGMLCDEFNQSLPKAREAYMMRASDPVWVFLCRPSASCPGGVAGGAAGTCAPQRDASTIACGLCEAGAYESEGECHACASGGVDALPFIIVGILSIVGLVVVTVAINRNLLMQTNSTLMGVIMLGMFFTGIQTLGIFDEMSIVWFEPMPTLFAIMKVLSFDLRILKTGCVIGSNPALTYGIRQCFAPASIPFIVVVLLVKRSYKPETKVMLETVNTIGSIFQIFFISVVVSAVMPLICYNHPNGTSSMRASPSVLCFGSDEHSGMLTVGILAFLMVPMPFFAMIVAFTYKYPHYASGFEPGSNQKLQAMRFLFFRYRPSRYYHGSILLTRNLLIPLVPALLRNEALQICVMAVILLSYLIIQQQLNPWRVTYANVVEGILVTTLVLLLMTGPMATDMTANEVTIATIGVFFFGLFVLAVLGAMAVALYRRFVPSPFYDYFICHHKADAAAQARFLKVLLLARGGVAVFIDSDDLKELDELFDIVKYRVATLVAYLTRDTLSRPWCVGELVSAFASRWVKVVAVKTPAYVPPTAEQLGDVGSYLDRTGCSLTGYGISLAMVVESFGKLEEEDRAEATILVPEHISGARYVQVVYNQLVQRSSPWAVKEPSQLTPVAGAVLFSANAGNPENAAAAAILESKVRAELNRESEQGTVMIAEYQQNLGGIVAAVALSRAVVVVLGTGSLECVPQLAAMAASCAPGLPNGDTHSGEVTRRPSAPLASGLGPMAVPVSSPGFAFPTAEWYSQVLPRTWPGRADQAQVALQAFFKKISVAFTTHLSDAVLDAQAQEIFNRLPKQFSIDASKSSSVESSLAASLWLPNRINALEAEEESDDDLVCF